MIITSVQSTQSSWLRSELMLARWTRFYHRVIQVVLTWTGAFLDLLWAEHADRIVRNLLRVVVEPLLRCEVGRLITRWALVTPRCLIEVDSPWHALLCHRIRTVSFIFPGASWLLEFFLTLLTNCESFSVFSKGLAHWVMGAWTWDFISVWSWRLLPVGTFIRGLFIALSPTILWLLAVDR